MTDTTFVDKTTVITHDWLNDVNDAVYDATKVSVTAPVVKTGTTLNGGITLSVSAASETASGVIELATAAEVTTGTDTTRAVTPAGAKVELDKKLVKANDLSDLASASSARTNLGLGTAATLDVGTTANLIVQLNASAQIPAVSGALLTNLPDQVPLTTKGDLFTFSTVDARIGVGSDGQYLKADSTQATGLVWTTPVISVMKVQAYRNTTQAISADVWATVTFDAESSDADGEHSAGVYTAGTAGWRHFYAFITTTGTQGNTYSRWLVSGESLYQSTATQTLKIGDSLSVYLAAGATVAFQVYPASAAATISAGAAVSYMNVLRST